MKKLGQILQTWQSAISILMIGIGALIWALNVRADSIQTAKELSEYRTDTDKHLDKIDTAIESGADAQKDTASALKVLAALFDERTIRRGPPPFRPQQPGNQPPQ